MKVKFKVDLNGFVTGQQIADAMKSLTGEQFYLQTSLVDDNGRKYNIGLIQSIIGGDLIIAVGANAEPDIDLGLQYVFVYVMNWDFAGEKTFELSPADIIERAKNFRDALQTLINGY